MALPNEFQASEHLRSAIQKTFNHEVREWFEDLDFNSPSIDTARDSLAVACTHQADDNFQMTLARTMLFETVRGRFVERLFGVSLDESGVSRYRGQVRRRHRPQITLLFIEDYESVEDGYTPVPGRISFRLMDHDSTSITLDAAKSYAERIKATFASDRGFVWKKGRDMFSYTEWDKGYQLQLLCRAESDARAIITSVLSIQGHAPNWSRLNIVKNALPSEAYPIDPPDEEILGETRKGLRARPVADVRFQYADLSISGLKNPVLLVDRSGILTNPLVK